MGELEPTRTYSNPTATDILRAMLDECGMEWKAPASYDGSTKYDTIVDGYWFHEYDGRITVHGLTPEQAIAATLKQAVRHPKPHEKWTTVLLPEIAWGWDDSWPDYLSVAHDANGEWRTYVPEATLGVGTCHIKPWKMERDTGFYDCMECECGYVSDVSDWAKWHFCPNCGRKVVDE